MNPRRPARLRARGRAASRPAAGPPRAGERPKSPLRPASEPPQAVPVSHPAFLLALLAVAACIVLSVSLRIHDPDLWEHLAVGRAIWQLHRVPTTQLWTWPTLGAPDLNSSWGFEALIWPLWQAWGVKGLFVWRWLTTLAAFGLMWGAARAMGSKGFAALGVMMVGALVYRQRSQVRPETIAAVLLALEVWILETRRHGGRDRARWLIGIAWVWANVHISYWIGLVVFCVYVVDGMLSRRGRAQSRGAAKGVAVGGVVGKPALAWVGVAMLAISLANPWGWRALWAPFDYALHGSQEAIMKSIGELHPVAWRSNSTNGLALLALAWPVLFVARWRRVGLDRVELMMLTFFSLLGFSIQRFLGCYALMATPYVARGLEDWLGRRRMPRLLQPAFARTALLTAACMAIALPEWSRADMTLGLDFDWRRYPVRACDFMAAHSVRGRGFNRFELGGYLLYRFWPERDRLPFMDVHQAGTREDRDLYVRSRSDPEGWRMLAQRHAFDWALVIRDRERPDPLVDFLDRDSAFACVFQDDIAGLFVRRGGALDSLARTQAYRFVPAGAASLASLGPQWSRDPVLRSEMRAELERAVAASPWNEQAKSLLASFALVDGRFAEARRLLEQVLQVNPRASRAWLRLGVVELQLGRPRKALDALEQERRLQGGSASVFLYEGSAFASLGDRDRARSSYLRALSFDPDNGAARESLAALPNRVIP